MDSEELRNFEAWLTVCTTSDIWRAVQLIRDALKRRFDKLPPDERVYLGMLKEMVDIQRSQL